MQANIEDFKETKYTYKGELKMLLTPDKKDSYTDIIYMPSSTVECCFSEKKIIGSGKSGMKPMYDTPTNSQPNAEASQNCLPDINLEELISYVKAGKMRKNGTSKIPAHVHCSINFDPLSMPITPPQPLIEDGEPRTQPCKKRRKFTPSRKRSHDSFQFKKVRSGNVKLYFADDAPSILQPVAKKIRLNSGQQSKRIDHLFKDDNKHSEVVVEIVLENSKEKPNDLLSVDDSVEWCETEIHALSLNSTGHVAVENEKSHILSSSQEMSLLKTDETESEYLETDIVESVDFNKKEIGKDILNNSARDQFQPAKTSEMCQNNSTDINPSISNSSEVLDTEAEVKNSLTVHHKSSLSSENAEKHLVGTEEDTNLFSSTVKCVALFKDNTSITKYKQCQIALCDFKTGNGNHSGIPSSQSKEVQVTNNIVKTKKSVLDLNNENVDIQESSMIDEGNVRPMRKTRSSTTKIRKTLPKIQVRHTPLGLPKLVRMKKEKFSLEDIYLNKNFRTPTEKKWETIFEFPKENKDGSVSTTEKRKKRRMCDFSTDPGQRKTRSKKSRLLKGRKYISRCKAEETENLLFQKLYRLDTALTLAQLSP